MGKLVEKGGASWMARMIWTRETNQMEFLHWMQKEKEGMKRILVMEVGEIVVQVENVLPLENEENVLPLVRILAICQLGALTFL
jgi:hypothetical protein